LYRRAVFIALSCVCLAAPARAELVYFATGRTLNVKSHRTEGGSLVLTLRGGGEVVCDPAHIARIEPDEAPYPEPAREEIGLKAEPTNGNPNRGIRLQPDSELQPDLRLEPVLEAWIDTVSAREGVDPRLVRAVIEVESGYEPRARSPKGAMGLMQLMPATARQYSVSNPYDPAANIEAGIKHLKSLLARFPQALALAAYNAGDKAVERFGGIPPYAETRNYVARILQIVGRS